MAVYRLSCACGEAVSVATGQAGGEIDCPRCGSRIRIPKLRQLRDLGSWDDSATSAAGGPPAGPTGSADRPNVGVVSGTATPSSGRYFSGRHVPGRHWGTAEAVLAAGSLVSAASLLVAAWLMRPATTGIDAVAIREAVERAPVADLYRAWGGMSSSGVDRGATPDEARAQRIVKNRAGLAVAMGLLGSTAALAAIGAAAAIVARRRIGGPCGRAWHEGGWHEGHALSERSGP